MLANEFTVAIEAKIQNQVAKFLTQKSVLVRLQGSSNPIVREQADGLYARQISLEDGLKDALKRIDNIKAGAYTMSDMTSVGAFATSMTKHIKQVEALARRSPGEAGVGAGALTVGALAIGGLAWMMKKKVAR